MAFSPFARFRNFSLDNLKALLKVYPDVSEHMIWKDVVEEVEVILPGYKKTAYQQACQLGLEDRGCDRFRIQSYLYTFDDENLMKYLKFWMKVYFAPNPYVKSEDDEPILIYCELVKAILLQDNYSINYYDFFNEKIGGKSEDILLNALKSYAEPVKYRKINNEDILYIESKDVEIAKREVSFIEENFAIGDSKNREEFFDRYDYSNYCKFYGILESSQKDNFINEKTISKRITGASNILLYGVPGAGKSHKIKTEYCANEKYMERVVFHPDYTYSDFVGQILPRVIDGSLKYVFTPGPFTKMLKKAEADPTHMYYLVVEEINRGNAPAIFGEIFQLLDRKGEEKYSVDEVGESEYGISNYDVALEVYGDAEHQVKVPSNMSILATMNTADQNVFTLDTAFQRRWDMKHIENNVLAAGHAPQKIGGTNVSWGVFATVINDMVIDISSDIVGSEDKRLGAYFVKESELVEDKFPEKVFKYLWDDAFKMEKDSVFRTEYKSLEDVITAYEMSKEDKLSAVLRVDVYNKMLSKMELQNDDVEGK